MTMNRVVDTLKQLAGIVAGLTLDGKDSSMNVDSERYVCCVVNIAVYVVSIPSGVWRRDCV